MKQNIWSFFDDVYLFHIFLYTIYRPLNLTSWYKFLSLKTFAQNFIEDVICQFLKSTYIKKLSKITKYKVWSNGYFPKIKELFWGGHPNSRHHCIWYISLQCIILLCVVFLDDKIYKQWKYFKITILPTHLQVILHLF